MTKPERTLGFENFYQLPFSDIFFHYHFGHMRKSQPLQTDIPNRENAVEYKRHINTSPDIPAVPLELLGINPTKGRKPHRDALMFQKVIRNIRFRMILK